MKLIERLPPASGCVFRQSFRSLREVQDAKGILTACSVNQGLRPTGATGRVVYTGTEGLLARASQMTMMLQFKMFSVNNAGAKGFCGKNPLSLNDNQFFVQVNPPGRTISLYITDPANPSDTANYVYITSALTLDAEITVHFVYNGALAAASRGVAYLNGAVTTTAIVGTLPTVMRTSASPFSVLSVWGNAPDNDFIMREVKLYNRAFSLTEVADDYKNLTYQGSTP